jgi:RND family efflux transporter MFP subunit
MFFLKRLSLALFTVLMSASVSAQGFGPAAVVVSDVEYRELSPSVEVPGTVISRSDSRLASELAAKLVWIAEIGTVVKKDEVVARMEDFTFRLLEAEAEGRVAREKARVKFLLSERERLSQLAANNLSARSQLDQNESDLAVAQSDQKIAEAQLGLAKVQMHITQIRAPFDGIVTERLRNVGERLNVADELIRIVDPQSLEVVARAPLSTVHYIKQNEVLTISNDYQQDKASVRVIVPFGNPQSHMFEVRLEVDPDVWTVGESVRLSMPTADVKKVLAVPRDALVLRRDGASVFKVKGDNTVEQISVITGLGDGSHIEVIGELSEGDQVVTRGAERLSPGMEVASTS